MIAAWFRWPQFLAENDPRRAELVRLANTERLRHIGRSPSRPSRWKPEHVRNPDDDDRGFTGPGAWQLVASELERGHRVEIVPLRRPEGATGYVMKIRLGSSNRPALYVKLELCRGHVFGRSFHYSDR